MNIKDLGNRAVLTRSAAASAAIRRCCARGSSLRPDEAPEGARALGSDVFTQTVDHATSVRAASTGSGRGAR